VEIISAIISGIKTTVELVIKAINWRSSRKKDQQENEQQKDRVDLLSRFLSLFSTRDVPRPLIPRFLAAQHLLTVHQACSNEQLLTALNDELIQHTAARLAVSSEWLYGTSSMPYPRFGNYKNPHGALELLERLLKNASSSEYPFDELLVVANESAEIDADKNSRVVILLYCQIDRVEGKDVEQVFVLEDDLPWCHRPAREYAKQLVLLAMVLGIRIRGTCVGQKNFSDFENGLLSAHQLHSINQGKWHPDDYVVLASESCVAKGVEEAAAVRDALLSERLLAKAVAVRVGLGRADLYQQHRMFANDPAA
jgi:hypothetical protein